jgi:hypothetical protein
MVRSKAGAASLLAGFRARRHRVRVLAVLAWLVVAQALLIVHRIDHASAGHEVACALCVAADHAAGPIAAPVQPIAHSGPAPVASRLVERAPASILVLSYRSRAPPDYLRS